MLAFGLVGLATLSACGSSGSSTKSSDASGKGSTATVKVVASTDVYGDIVRQIAGKSADITSIIDNPDADPHSYEADTQNQLALSKADIVVENGGGYDDFMDTMLKASHNKAATVLNVVDISGKTAPKGGELNEHVWYDFPTMTKLTDKLVAALTKAEPKSAATFKANAKTFTASLDELNASVAKIKSAHAGEGVGITEPVPLYLLDNAGLVNHTPDEFSEAIEEGTGVSAAVLKETTELYANHKVKALIYNSQTSGPETTKVLAAAKSAGIPAVPVTETLPKGKNYLSWMQSNVAAVAKALN